MSIISFFTPQVSNQPQNIENGGLNGALDGAAAELGIFGLLLAQLQQTTTETPDAPQSEPDAQSLQSDNPLLDTTPSLNPAELLTSTEEIEDDALALQEVTTLDTIGEIEQALALNQRAIDETLKPVKNAKDLQFLIGDKAISETNFINQLKSFVQKIESLTQNSNQEGSILSLNLTPEQLTQLQQQLETIKNSDDSDIAALFIGIGQFVKPNAVAPINTAKPVNTAPNTSTNALTADTPENTLAARLNGLVVGEDGVQTSAEFDADFEQIIKEFSGKKGYTPNTQGLEIGKTPSPQTNQSPVTPGLSALQGLPFTFENSLFASSTFSQEIAEALGLVTQSGQAPLSAASSLVSQAQSAGQAHPATHLVAATLQKAGSGGENTNITLQLDPPDLGRVEVKMTFGKDKSMKAIVTSEKPETFLMLQRDAQVLERALQDAGIDSEGGLSFELAEDGNFMNDQNERGGGHDQGGTGAGETDEDLEIIESTMTWHVDPETGHTRYEIWA